MSMSESRRDSIYYENRRHKTYAEILGHSMLHALIVITTGRSMQEKRCV